MCLKNTECKKFLNSDLSLLSLIWQQSRIIALCAYRDMSGMFTIENKASCSAKEDAVIRSHSEAETIIQDLRWDDVSQTVTTDCISLVLCLAFFLFYSCKNNNCTVCNTFYYAKL